MPRTASKINSELIKLDSDLGNLARSDRLYLKKYRKSEELPDAKTAISRAQAGLEEAIRASALLGTAHKRVTFKEFLNLKGEETLPYGLKIVSVVLSICFTAFLVGDALQRILDGLESPAVDQDLIEQSAALATIIVLVGLGTSTVRLLAGIVPAQGIVRLCSVLALSGIAIAVISYISENLSVTQAPVSTIVSSVALILVLVVEDCVVMGMLLKREEEPAEAPEAVSSIGV